MRASISSVGMGLMAVLFLPVFAEKAVAEDPPNVIFDTDMCLDDDDGMALAMVHALQERHEANLVAVTLSLDEKWCAPYADVLNTFYGHADVPIGTVRNGLSLEMAMARILKALEENGWPVRPKQPDTLPKDTFAQAILKRKNPDGSPTYPHRLTDGSRAPEAVSLIRKTLSAQPDRSVVMIQVGNSVNFAALLDSHPDASSDLDGIDLIKKKVRFLSVMAGTFQDVRMSNGDTIVKGAGINIFEDVPSAQKLFNEWPTPVAISGVEIGEAIRIPGVSVERDFSYVPHHPIAEAYRYGCAVSIQAENPKAKCPHDHHTADPTATLYALRPDRDYFSLSNPGRITVLPNGNVRFAEDKKGNHRYLIVSAEQKIRAQEAITMLVSQPPVALQRRGNEE